MLTDLKKFNKFIEDRTKFSNETFGTPSERTCIAPLLHLQEEVVELIENPADTMEWADCMLLLLDAARRKGHSPDQLFDFCYEKLQVNKKRTWTQSANGVYLHDKSDSNDEDLLKCVNS